VIGKKKKDGKKRIFAFVWIEAKKNECIRSLTIEDLPLLLAGRYDNSLPPRFLAPIDSLKIPALVEVRPTRDIAKP
jgi:hypothetical protein